MAGGTYINSGDKWQDLKKHRISQRSSLVGEIPVLEGTSHGPRLVGGGLQHWTPTGKWNEPSRPVGVLKHLSRNLATWITLPLWTPPDALMGGNQGF